MMGNLFYLKENYLNNNRFKKDEIILFFTELLQGDLCMLQMNYKDLLETSSVNNLIVKNNSFCGTKT